MNCTFPRAAGAHRIAARFSTVIARPAACALALLLLALSTSSAARAAPLTLERAIAAAIRNNPDLAVLPLQHRVLDARSEQAGQRPPLTVAIDLENVLGTGDTRGTRAAEATLALSSVVELAGKRASRIDAAHFALGVFATERSAKQLDVLAEVTRRFIHAAASVERVHLAERATSLAEHTLADAERRVRAAKAPHVEVDRAEIAAARARLAESRSLAEAASARRQLAATWGASDAMLDGTPIGDLDARLLDLPAVADFDALAARLDASPDFLRFASESRLRDAELRLAQSQRRPDLQWSAGVRRLQESRDQAFVAGLSIPLGSARRAESGIAEARAQRDLVDAERAASQVRVRATLHALHSSLRAAVAEAIALRTTMLPRIEEALKETQYAFDRGRYGYLELVDAQREYLDVQSALIDASADAHLLQTEIERLTAAALPEDSR
jgi:cobalt-zinc-cadmium efflux system outer membrane protein